MAIVLLIRTDLQQIGIDPSEVFALTPVPPELVPQAIPAATYINDGDRLSVVGTVAEVAALLEPAPPPATLSNAFAPRVVVGNVPAGDEPAAQSAPFQYVPDEGDGAGIAVALAAAAVSGGLVFVRRGIYDFGLANSPALPLAVAGCSLVGEGAGTILRLSPLDRRLLLLSTVPTTANRNPEAKDFTVDYTSAAAGASGSEMIDAAGSQRATIVRLEVVKNVAGGGGGPVLNPDESLTSIVRTGIASRVVNCRLQGIDGTAGLTVVGFRTGGFINTIDDCTVNGCNVGIRLESIGGSVGECNLNGGTIFASSTGIEVSGFLYTLGTTRIASVTDGLVVQAGGGISATGVMLGPGLPGDGIRVEGGALSPVITANNLFGNPLVVLEPTAEVSHNVL